MTEFLTLETLLRVAERATGAQPVVRDYGLLEAALVRPQTSVFGADAYPTLWLKASALLHSLVNSPGLVDGNKRLGWAATAVFCRINDYSLDAFSDDAAYDLVIATETSAIELEKIAEQLEAWSQPV